MKRGFIAAACLITLTCSLAHAGRVGVLTGLGGPETFNSATPTFSGATPGLNVLGTFDITTDTVPSPDPLNPNASLPPLSNASAFEVTTAIHTAGMAFSDFTWTVKNAVHINKVKFRITPSGAKDYPTNSSPPPAGVVFTAGSGITGWTANVSDTILSYKRDLGFELAGANPTFPFEIGIWSFPNPAYFNVAMEASNPEPGSIALGGFAVALLSCVAVRRRRKRKLAELENTETTS